MPMTNDEIAHTMLSARHALLAAVWLVVRDASAAEDIFQDVVVKALGGSGQFEHAAELRSWCMIAARRQALDFARRVKPRFVQLNMDVLELLSNDGLRAPGNLKVEALKVCFEGLPEKSRELIKKRYFDELPCAEIAKAMRLELDAVYQRMARLHRTLKECVERRLAVEAGVK